MAVTDYKGIKPKISANAFVAESADVIGNVTLKEDASIWFKCVVRADVDEIIIGKSTNIQDGTIIHCDAGIPTRIGNNVTVGHGAIIHACSIEDNVLIGMGAIILDEAEIGEGSIIGAGAVVTPRTMIPPNSLVLGTPAKVIKELDPKNQEQRIKHAKSYAKLSKNYY